MGALIPMEVEDSPQMEKWMSAYNYRSFAFDGRRYAYDYEFDEFKKIVRQGERLKDISLVKEDDFSSPQQWNKEHYSPPRNSIFNSRVIPSDPELLSNLNQFLSHYGLKSTLEHNPEAVSSDESYPLILVYESNPEDPILLLGPRYVVGSAGRYRGPIDDEKFFEFFGSRASTIIYAAPKFIGNRHGIIPSEEEERKLTRRGS